MLREDRTAADKKHVAYCDPPQAENPASEILIQITYVLQLPARSQALLCNDL